MPDAIEQEVKNIIAEVLELEPGVIESERPLASIAQVDSVALLEILVAIERKYQIDLMEDELRAITQLDQMLDLIRKKVAAKNQATGSLPAPEGDA